MNKKNILREITDLAIVTLGVAMYAVALTFFLAPNGLSTGGVTGLATVIGDFFHLPIGLLTIALNTPLIVWGFIKIGKKFIIRTAIATIIMSVLIDLFDFILPVYNGDRLLAALYGGFISGIGLALVFLRGSSTGGTDIAAKIISSRFPQFSIGKMVLLLDAIVILISAIVYRSFETALYTTLTIFISSKAIDSIVYGADKGKLVMIVTSMPEKITQAIFDALDRGVTIIPAKGGYKGDDRSMLMCAVRITEATKLHRIVNECDKSAFIIVTDAGEIKGEGFEKQQ